MNGHEGHVQAVGFAGLKITDFQDAIGALRDKHQECVGLVIIAVGENPSNEHAQNATAWTAGIGEKLDEIVRMCDAVKEEMNSYTAFWQ